MPGPTGPAAGDPATAADRGADPDEGATPAGHPGPGDDDSGREPVPDFGSGRDPDRDDGSDEDPDRDDGSDQDPDRDDEADEDGIVSATGLLVGWWTALRTLRGLGRGLRWRMAAAVACFTVASAGDALAIRMMSRIVDRALAAGSLTAFWRPAALWGAIAVVAAGSTMVGTVLTARAAEEFELQLRARLHAHLLTLAPDGVDGRRTGDLISRLTGDVEETEHLLVSSTVGLVAASVTAGIFLAAAVRLRWDLALVVIASVPALWLLNRVLERPARRAARAERVAAGRLTCALEDGLGRPDVVQACTADGAERARLDRRARTLLRARMREHRLGALQSPIVELLETLGVLAVLAVGTRDIAQHRLTTGGLLAFAAYLGFLYPPLTALGQLRLTVAAALPSAERVQEVLRTPAEIEEPAEPTPVPDGPLELRLEGVGHRLLDDVDLRVGPGELVLVTGRSGAGKSTLASLLVRFHDPDRGRILLGGVDLRELSPSELRRAVTLLPQDPGLVAGTIEDNLRYGSPDADPRAVRRAVTVSGTDQVVHRLPDRLRTVLGPRGRGLSGGQQRRVALARTLLRGGRVVVLDEPTAGLDQAGAADLLTALRGHLAGQAAVVVSHDLRLAPVADRVLLLERGRIVGYGPHRELVRSSELYRELLAGAGRPVPSGQRPSRQRPVALASRSPNSISTCGTSPAGVNPNT